MSVHLFVGPSGSGKTYTMSNYLVPAFLWAPEQVTQLAPADGYTAALIADPSTVEFPDGQYDGPRYADVAEWRRAERRSRVARFENASVNALCDAGVRYGRLVLCLDDMERELGSERTPSPEATEIVTRGRLHGCVLIGACRRMMAIHTSVRANVETVYFGNLTDEQDRNYAAKIAGVDANQIRAAFTNWRDVRGRPSQPPPGLLLEWKRQSGQKALIRIEGRQKLIVASL